MGWRVRGQTKPKSMAKSVIMPWTNQYLSPGKQLEPKVDEYMCGRDTWKHEGQEFIVLNIWLPVVNHSQQTSFKG
jgi:hypothetical protein